MHAPPNSFAPRPADPAGGCNPAALCVRKGDQNRGAFVTEDAEQRNRRLDRAVTDCAEGRPQGIDAILELEGPRLLGLARRILIRHDLAEEALQDAMVMVWRKAAQQRQGDGSSRGWIYAILRNRCLTILRDGARLSSLSPDELTSMQEARQELVSDDDWKLLAGKGRLGECLDALDDPARRAILLAHVAGYSHGEISARQGVPLGTAKSWIRRGLASLRECLS
ncbi:sigma-70 family RNA polymerase sigma factor [Paracoccus hibiscisoli]|uniref:Sigma-70 family RNA polymerase sigma factor n=1 Tax=Paracoccus hibiscisoli TaxID=2023261 RepID=A0A4U0QR05_9RHOB|nr:sigma-70 family RNA polymerase sigma factor [Paracoccus hibiscisoli]